MESKCLSLASTSPGSLGFPKQGMAISHWSRQLQVPWEPDSNGEELGMCRVGWVRGAGEGWEGPTSQEGFWEAPPGTAPGLGDSHLCPWGQRVGALKEAKKREFFST